MKSLFYLPTLIAEAIKSFVPLKQWWYKPSSESIRQIEEDVRNEARLVAYKLKRNLL